MYEMTPVEDAFSAFEYRCFRMACMEEYNGHSNDK
jgi:hypothetical protein